MNKLKSSILSALVGVLLAAAPIYATLTHAADDTTPPSTPTGLSAVLNVGGQVFLDWNPATDNIGVTGYTVVRNDSIIANTVGTSYIDTAVTPDTTYSYTIMAYDAAGNISSSSAVVIIKTNASGDTQIPSAPTNLTAVANSATQVALNWSPATDNVAVTGYIIIRNNTALAYSNNTNYTDNSAQANTVYTYIILAFDAAGNISDSSSAVSITTPSTPADTISPTAPANLTAIAASSSRIDLNWSAATDNVGVTGYNIFRNNVKIATSSTLTFADTGLNASTTYTYNVTAFDAANNVSAASNTATATTLAATPSGDTTSPSAVTNLMATAITSAKVTLNWPAATDNVGVTGYYIYRDNLLIANTSNTSFNDTGLNASTTYAYYVRAFDAAGNLSANSNTATVTTLGLKLPADCDHNNDKWQNQKHENEESENQEHEDNGNHYGQRKAELRVESQIEGQAKFTLPFGQIMRVRVHAEK